MMKNLIPVLLLFLLAGCAASKKYDPARKFAPWELQKDYEIFRNVLEESHPSLYWYTPKDSMDYYFELGASKLKDSLSEYKFRYVLSYVLAQIKCGHTSVKPSKAAVKYAERSRGYTFPLGVKLWKDTVVITSNLNRNDSILKRGYLLQSIEGKPVQTIVDTFFRHLSADGYNTTHKYQTLSNPGVFRTMYSALFGLHLKMNIEYLDASGELKTDSLPVYSPVADTLSVRMPIPSPSKKEVRHQYLLSVRNMRIDSSLNTAFMEVNSFTKENKLRGFLRHSFKQIRKQRIQNLVIDMRGNGGGNVMLSNLLTAYIADKPFKIADSLYALRKKSSYGEYIQNNFFNRLFFMTMMHKKSDGHYHFTWFEHRYFKPKKKNHFNGNTYVLIGGNTFSAATIFVRSIKGQPDVTVVGEETGGSTYGNTAWLIPDVTLPYTKVRFRLPLLRLVSDKNERKGNGVIPDVQVLPTVDAIRRNADYKMDKVIQLIKAQQNKSVQR